jgi:hypothetical protein
LVSKPVATFFSDLASKLVTTVFSHLALKPVMMISHSLASKPVMMVSPDLKNARATFQRDMNLIFHDLLGIILEIYIDVSV